MLKFMELQNLALRPNCLLTKVPLVFLTGARSLFHFKKIGINLDEFLYQHGYVVITVPLPFRYRQLRKLAFKNWLEKHHGKSFHFILGPETKSEFNSELSGLAHSTVSIIGENLVLKDFKFSRTPLTYYLHHFFCWISSIKAERYENTLPLEKREDYDRFLDHCVQLAEDEVPGDHE